MSLEALAALHGAGLLRPVDLHFARLMAGHADTAHDAIALLAALLSVELGRGHVCVELAAVDGKPFAALESELAPRLDAAQLRAALAAEPRICAAPATRQPRPLVLDGDRVYLHRYWAGEGRVAARLRALAARHVAAAPDARAMLDRLYADDSPGTAGQKLACAMALTRALGVITGGPGTGKTTTVAKLLVMLAATAEAGGRRLAIRLAAPTGKAAARVGEALAREVAALAQDGLVAPQLLAQLPTTAQTLHRLLGAGARGLRHDAANPLAADVVVLDESSMVDLRLLDALLAALPRDARLLLLGDRDQLAAVEAGNVFGALCGRARGPGVARAAELAALTGLTVEGNDHDDPVSDAIAVLGHSYRFDAASGIGRFAEAVNAGDATRAATVLAEKPADVRCLPCTDRLDGAALERMREGYRGIAGAARGNADPATLVRLQESFRVLCALREGDWGVAGVNRALTQVLAEAGLAERGRTHYAGRPLIVTRNDYGLGLYNGDMGIVVEDEDGHPQALFAQAGGGVKRLPAARLPEHETAYALTVHKSQGSEFDEVVLVLPPAPAAGAGIAGRELLYTAITRARRRLELVLPGGALDARWLRASEYRSGLADRL
jgi:exodeoxyribonuclease V alpha subunit